jgi:hypothetical protein
MENYFAVTLFNPLIRQWHMSVYNTVRIYGVTGAYWTVAYLGLFLLFNLSISNPQQRIDIPYSKVS